MLKALIRTAVLATAAILAAGAPLSAAGLIDVPDKLKIIERKPFSAYVGTLFQFWGVFEQRAEDYVRLRRMEVKFYGNLLPKLQYEIMFDPAKQLDRGFDKSILQNLFVKLLLPLSHELQLGQFKLPLSEEGFRSSSKLDFVDRSLAVKALGDRRDIGGMLTGNSKYGFYQFAVVKGEELNTGRNHDRKDLVLRLVAKPLADHPEWGKLEAGWVGYWRPSAAHLPEKERLGYEARYEQGPFSVKSEWLMGQTGRVKPEGWYLQGGYFLRSDLQGVVRFEDFDPNERTALDRGRDLTLGLNYFLDKHQAKVQFNWVHKDEQGRERVNDLLLLALQIAI